MGPLKIDADDIGYAVRQMGTVPDRPFGGRHWETHLAHLEENEKVPSDDSLFNYLCRTTIFMRDLEQRHEDSGDARGMRDVITFVYSTALSANEYVLPLVRKSDVDRVADGYQPPITTEMAESICNDTAHLLSRVDAVWGRSFFAISRSTKMSPIQWVVACSCALALLEKFGVAIESEPKEEARMPEESSRRREADVLSAGQVTDIHALPKTAEATTFDDIGGCHEAKRELIRLAKRVNQPSVVVRWGGTPTKGVLLHGPKGTGKTTLVQAFAHEVNLPFFQFRVSDVMSMWVNDSPRQLRAIFSQVRNGGGGIVFFDEADALLVHRGKANSHHEDEKLVNEWNGIMDSVGPEERIIVFLATNFMENLDEAAIRDGRIDKIIAVGMPNEADREEVFRVHALRIERYAQRAVFAEDVRFRELARRTDGVAPAGIRGIMQHAVDTKIDDDIEGRSPSLISTEDLIDAIAARSAQRHDRAECRIGFTCESDPRPPTPSRSTS